MDILQKKSIKWININNGAIDTSSTPKYLTVCKGFQIYTCLVRCILFLR